MPKASLSKTFKTRRKHTGEGAVSGSSAFFTLKRKFFDLRSMSSLYHHLSTIAQLAALLAAMPRRGEMRGQMEPAPTEKLLRSG